MKPRDLQRLLGGRRGLVMTMVASLAALLVLAGTAAAYFSYTDSSGGHSAASIADSLPQGATPGLPATTPNLNSNTVSVAFAQATTTSGGVAIPASQYQLKRYPAAGGSAVAVTASCSGTGTITCTEPSVPDGRWQYTDTTTYGQNWVGAESSKSATVTVDTTPPSVSISAPVTGTTYGANWGGSVSGTASDATSGVASVQVAIQDTKTGQWWNGTSFAAGSQTFVNATGTTSWSYALAAGKLTSGDSYAVTAKATDAVGNAASSSQVTFTYSTAAPSASVTYPANNVTYDGNWTGTITGTASSSSGTTLTSTVVAIEDTTAGKWWNGSSFSATTASYQPTGGTPTSWTYGLAASALTSGDSYTVSAQATDSASNVGTSSTITFFYNTTHPNVTVTYPITGATYDGNWTGTITGTASAAAGTATLAATAVAIKDTTAGKWWDGTGFNATSQTFLAATGTTSWSYALAASKLTSGDSYSVIGQATDSAGNVGTSAAVAFTYNTTHPTVAVSYPTTSTTYGANWTGTITGTATSGSGGGTSIASTAVAIEDTTATKWWDGTGFNATAQTFVAATGTASWTYALAASKLTSGHSYSVMGQATDSIGNVGTSSTITFTYNTSAPSVAVTYPVNNTTYGSNWTGTITGTAGSNAGAGTSIASTVAAIEDTTAGKWWNGSSFSATSASYQPTGGTATSWTYALAASTLTSGHIYTVTGQATDSAGNQATSSTVTFTYSTVTSLGEAAATSASGTLTVPNITTVNNATYLIAVYCQGYQSACGSNNAVASVNTGTGTPFASTPAQTNLGGVGTGTSKDCLELIEATGNGTTGTVTVNGNGGNVIFANVIQLSSGYTPHTTPPLGKGTTSPATAALSAAGAWIVPVAVTDGNGGTTITAPSGWTALGNPLQSPSSVGGADLSVFFNPSAPAVTTNFTLNPTNPLNGWATIAEQVG